MNMGGVMKIYPCSCIANFKKVSVERKYYVKTTIVIFICNSSSCNV